MRSSISKWWYVRYNGVTIYGAYLPLVSPVFIPTCDIELIEATAWAWKGSPLTGVLPEVKRTDLLERGRLQRLVTNKTLPSITLMYRGEPLTVVGFNAPKYGLRAKKAWDKVIPQLEAQRKKTGHHFFVRENNYRFAPLEIYTPPPKYYLLDKYIHPIQLCLMCNKNKSVWDNICICKRCAGKKAFIYRIRDDYQAGRLIFSTLILEHKTVSIKELDKYIPPPYAKASVAVMANLFNTFMVDDELFDFF